MAQCPVEDGWCSSGSVLRHGLLAGNRGIEDTLIRFINNTKLSSVGDTPE